MARETCDSRIGANVKPLSQLSAMSDKVLVLVCPFCTVTTFASKPDFRSMPDFRSKPLDGLMVSVMVDGAILNDRSEVHGS